MKALSLWQPWASLIALGEKRVETRSWVTPYRGELAIHAGVSTKAKELFYRPAFREVYKRHGINLFGALPTGAVVAVARLVEIRPTEQLRPDLSDQERAFGDYTAGRFGWLLEDIVALEQPVTTRGYQQVWTLAPEAAQAVREQLERQKGRAA